MKKLWYALLILAGIAGVVVGVIQMVMAVRYGELMRVVVYFGLALFSAMAFLAGVYNLFHGRKSKDYPLTLDKIHKFC